MTGLPDQNFRALKYQTRLSTLTTVIVWIRRVIWVTRLFFRLKLYRRGYSIVRYHDVRRGIDVIEFVRDDVGSDAPAAPSGKEPDGRALSQRNRGGRG